jgi:asparagine synthase (glutamine-hydrolysing)
MLEEMTGCLRHEPFYTSGTLREEGVGLGVGWACHQGAFCDCLPIWNSRNDLALIFVGEHFAHGGPGSENAVGLLQRYEDEGEKFFEQLNGWFAGILLDLRRRTVVLFNDRYGMGRVYYHENADGFFFSSEAKALLRVLPGLRRLDEAGLGEFFACGCPLQNRTLFAGVSLLPSGAKWTFSPSGQVRKESLFHTNIWEQQSHLSNGEFGEKLKGTLGRVIPRYFQGRQPVGMSLTGGLDGRMIMTWASRPPGTLRCYSFNGPYRDCADVTIARAVAAACGQPHEVIPVGDRFLAEFPALAEKTVFLTDGAMDVTGAVELYVNRQARDIAPVRLTGNYGSEILRANVAFRPGLLPEELFSSEMNLRLREAAAAYHAATVGNRLSFIACKQVPWHHWARFAVEQSQLTVRSPYLDNELVALAYQAPPRFGAGPEPLMRLIAETRPALARIPTDRGCTYPARGGLNKLRRMCREFLARAEYAYDYGMPQWAARLDHALGALHLERLFLGRQKFYHFRVWYRDRLASYLKEVLLDQRTLARPYLNGRRVEAAVMAHIRGTRNYTVPIHKMLTVELLQRRLLEQT